MIVGKVYTVFHYITTEEREADVFFRGAYIDITSAMKDIEAATSKLIEKLTPCSVGYGDLPRDEMSHMSLHRNSQTTGDIVWTKHITWQSWDSQSQCQQKRKTYFAIRATPLNGSPLHALAEQADDGDATPV